EAAKAACSPVPAAQAATGSGPPHRCGSDREAASVMSVVAILALATLSIALGVLLWREQRGRRHMTPSPRRILLPIAGTRMSERALDAALRLALAEDATLVPAFLATVPMRLPVDTAVPRQCETAMPMLEAIEQRP